MTVLVDYRSGYKVITLKDQRRMMTGVEWIEADRFNAQDIPQRTGCILDQ